MEEFKGKVVLITGSSAGIGAGLAAYLAARGARLSLTGRDVNSLKAVAQTCVQAGVKPNDVLTSAGDVTDEVFRKQLVTKTVDAFGRLDILVNNAGAAYLGQLSDLDLNAFQKAFDLNLTAAVSLSSLAVPHLLKTKGNIVNVSSNLSLRPSPGLGMYCMTKAALDMFTKVLALELAPKGVRVNSVNPGCVRSAINRSLGMDKQQYEGFLVQQAKQHPVGRVGETEDVSRAVAFLASENSSFITGECMVVDGAGRYGSSDIV